MLWILLASALVFSGFAAHRATSPRSRVGWLALLVVLLSLLLAARIGGRVLAVALPVLMGLLWRWLQATEDTARAGGSNGTGWSHATMTREDALRVLGLAEGADREAIADAHRGLIKKVHPDHGGSDYLAQQVNEAKRVLESSAER